MFGVYCNEEIETIRLKLIRAYYTDSLIHLNIYNTWKSFSLKHTHTYNNHIYIWFRQLFALYKV